MTTNGFKRVMGLALIVGVALCFGTSLALAERQAQPTDTQPGPAFTTLDGKVVKIEGNVFTIQSQTTNYQNYASDLPPASPNVSEVRIFVGKDTKRLQGEKKVGDKIRAEVTEGGFANSIQ